MSYSKPTSADSNPGANNPNEQAIRVDGFDQVLQMLRAADPEFRESILRRLAARDQNLVRSLRADLGI